MKQNLNFLSLIFVLAFSGGIYLAGSSWGGLRYIDLSDGRSPSAIAGVRDFSSYRGSSLSNAAEFHFASQSKVEATDEGLDIYLDQFVMRDQAGQKNFVCRVEGRKGVFDRVELVLEGLGISEAGRVPELIVQSDCVSEPDLDQIGPIRISIPMAEIYKLKPMDQELSLFDKFNSSIRIFQMVSEWPTQWRIKSVKYFLREEPQDMLTLELPQKEKAHGFVTFSWPQVKTAEPVPQKF